jgi:hypothetical protein
MKYLKYIFFSCAMASAAASLQAASNSEENSPSGLVETIIKNTPATATPSDFCALSGPGSKVLKTGRKVVLLAERKCKYKYSENFEYQYEIMIDGDRLFIEKESIIMLDSDLEKLKLMSMESSEQYFNQSKELSYNIRKSELTELNQVLSRGRTHGINIISASVNNSLHNLNITGFDISVINPTERQIKYLWFTVIGKNRVGDPVKDPLQNKFSLEVQAIGPLIPGASSMYQWRHMWRTSIVESFDVSRIKIQYMDGSTKIVTKPNVLMLTHRDRMLLESTIN